MSPLTTCSLLVTELSATTALKPQAWTFASPRVLPARQHRVRDQFPREGEVEPELLETSIGKYGTTSTWL